MKQLGTIRLKIPRIYCDATGTEIWVDSGVYPLFLDDGEIFWTMSGYINSPSDSENNPSDEIMVVNSNRITEEEFYEWAKEDEFTSRFILKLFPDESINIEIEN